MLANEILVFIYVVKAGNISKAAKLLDLTPAGISKAINRLEAYYDVKLLNRTTRSISMTEHGILLFQRSEGILDILKNAENQLIQAHTNPRGKIKLAAPTAFSEVILSKILPEFLKKYREIDIELFVENRREFPEPGEYDLLIKAGNHLSDQSNFRAKLLVQWKWVMCTSPGYLKIHGEPKNLESLEKHICLDYNYRESGRIWILKRRSKQNEKIIIEEFKVKHQSNLDTSHGSFVIACACNDGGIVLIPRFSVQDEINSGKLIPILTDFYVDPINVYLIHSYKPSTVPKKIKLLMDFIYNKVREIDCEH